MTSGNAKGTALPAITTLSANDKFVVIDDPVSNPVTSTATSSVVSAFIQSAWPGYNVMKYGAIGDGVADDTSKFAAALSAIRAAGGGALYIPAGTYKITSTINVNLEDAGTHLAQSLVIYGDGGLSRINYTPADGTDCFYILNIAAGTNTLAIHDLTLNGPGVGSGNGINLRRCIMPHSVRNLTIQNFGGGAGILCQSCWMGHYDNLWFYLNQYAIRLIDDPIPGPYGSTVNILISTCHIAGQSSHGIYGNCNHLTIDTCIMEGNTGRAIYLDHARHVDIRNIYFETNGYAIYGVHTPYISIRHCGSGGSATDVFLDVDCTWTIQEENEWGGSVTINGYGVRSYVSDITAGTGDWRNIEATGDYAYFGANDTSPSVASNRLGRKIFYTANTNPTSIFDLHDGYANQEVMVIVGDALTTFDFSASGLKGNSGVDYVAANGDALTFRRGPSFWHLVGIAKV